MWKYVAKRILYVIPVILGVTLIVYVIMSMAPGDPVLQLVGEQATPEQIEAKRAELGLDKPVLVQYVNYIFKLVQGDFGISYKSKQGVALEITSRFPTTLKMSLTAVVIAVVIALPLGVIAAVKQNTWVDGVSMFISLLGVSIPIFWLGLMLLLFFSLKLGWFPASGTNAGWRSYVLPGFSLGFQSMATIARTTRSSMLETIRQDYIRTARSKGVPYGTVIRRHALRNALIPTVTVTGLQVGSLLAGSVLTETVFGMPGLGRFMISSISGRDTPAVLGCIIVFTVTFSLVNLLVDLLYGFIDPRIRSQYS